MAEESNPFSIETYTAGDGYSLRYRRYDPRVAGYAEPRAHVVCLHGIQSHAGWYDYSSTKLCQAGYLVSFLDRRGSGMNQQDRGDAPSFRQLLDEVACFLSRHHPDAGLPLFLVAISWGGKVAVALQQTEAIRLHGMALLCPGIFPKVGPTLRERLAIAWARLVAPAKRFCIPLSDPELFTANPSWQAFIRDDPLSLHEATARLLVESVRLDRTIRSAADQVRVPVLLMLAEHDRIIDNERTRKFVERFASVDKQIIEYLGAHHTLEFEANPDIFIGDLVRWLDRHSAKSPVV